MTRVGARRRTELHVAEQWIVGVRWFHRTCAAFIGLAVAFIALSKWTGFLASHSVLIGEAVVVKSNETVDLY